MTKRKQTATSRHSNADWNYQAFIRLCNEDEWRGGEEYQDLLKRLEDIKGIEGLEKHDLLVKHYFVNSLKIELADASLAFSKTDPVKVKRPPSRMLYVLGDIFLIKRYKKRVLEPLITDFEDEYFEALANEQPTWLIVTKYLSYGVWAIAMASIVGPIATLRKRLGLGGD